MHRSAHILILLAALTGPFGAYTAHSQHVVDPDRSSRFDREGLSLDEAVQRAQRRYNARAVKAEVSGDGERRVYVIRLMNDSGRVWTVRVDAQSGNMF